MNRPDANGTQATQTALEAPAENGATSLASNGPTAQASEKDKQKPPRKEDRKLAIWGILAAVVLVLFVRLLVQSASRRAASLGIIPIIIWGLQRPSGSFLRKSNPGGSSLCCTPIECCLPAFT